ncbi:MAG: hypothetical protein ACJAVN_000261 [Roseivirga sp.]|jgi:hypothetical protein
MCFSGGRENNRMWYVNETDTMKFKRIEGVIHSPIAYKRGFQIAQQEYDRFLEINSRLNQIKAYQQLKQGELFLELIEA